MPLAVVAFIAALAAANAGIITPSAKILQGPSSKTTLVGPEGSVISSVAPGGQVITEELPGVVAHAAPVVAAAPLVAAAPAVVAYSTYTAPVPVAHAAPATYGTSDVVVAGPSGIIATGKSIAAPAVVAPQSLPVAPVAQVVVPSGYGLEGEYVHDTAESLYDDGSYKPYAY
ncbi:hypothetical protein NQ314_009774 [Rhamnusium bicolor]|uniref:Uncharacterized protein n=1 Tax=Rhamnusium bicolor TaxID=1586634 RepID=A0AAV8XW82_9CUCU|nr:hypothetical protein NQ314_009774 [Rhamnusium bicolor]